MDYSRFSKKELSTMLDIIHSTLACKNEDGIKEILGRLTQLVSADYSICGFGKGASDGLADTPQVINGSYPLEWLMIYGKEQLYFKDPIIWHNFQHPGAQLWDDTYQKYSDKLSRSFVTRSKEFGLRHGVSGGIYDGSTGLSTIFTFAGPKRTFTEHEKDIMEMITPHLHQVLVRMQKENQNPLAQLSSREKEVIRWIKEGKTNWEISMILNISERTVKFHVQNIERKLNAVNKAHAIAIALDANLAEL